MSENKSLLRRAFDLLWGAVVLLYRVVVIAGVLLGLGLLWLTFSGGPAVVVEDNVALVLAPSGSLVEQVDLDPSQEFFENVAGEAPSQSNLHELIEALDAARDDERISFAVLKLDGLWYAGLAQLDELRTAMAAFQAAGKQIVAWGPWYDQSHFYAAAQADEISLDPYGMVYVEGFSSYNNYYAEAIEKIGINMNVFRVGTFKSAVEPFTRNNMSDEARAANREWLGDLWQAYGAAVADGRGLPAEAADRYVAGLRDGLQAVGGDAAAYARDQSLVTRLEDLTEFRARMGETVGFDEDHGSFRQIHYLDYLDAVRASRAPVTGSGPNKIALVVVQGEIVDGPGEPGQAGGDTIFELLEDARRDEEVAAVVLRIDSPGGSVWAAEQIRRAVRNLQSAGKPVVASMSSVAASGGYWVAMDADQIWAHETTITGSIGVFGLVPTFDGTLKKLGIHTDGVGTTPLAGAFRLDRPLSADAGAIIQAGVEKVYRDFIEGVAAGRELAVERVDEIAQGRVWSGADAREFGLIDQFGSRQDAADAAAALVGLAADAYVLDERRPSRGFTAEMLAQFSSRAGGFMPSGWLAWIERLQSRVGVEQVLAAFNDPRGQYAHCFCSVSGGQSPR
jgi:protease-4